MFNCFRFSRRTCKNICNAIIYVFDTQIYKLGIFSTGGIIELVDAIKVLGGGTDLTLPLRAMVNNDIEADRLILISDNQINYFYSGVGNTCQYWANIYRRSINPNLWVHAIDLAGYGTQQFIGARTNIIAGWNEKILEFISLAEQGIDAQIKRIENYGKEVGD